MLEKKIDFLEIKSHNSSIEIRNVPMANGETTSDMCNIALNLGKTLQVPLGVSEIKNIHRGQSKSDKNRPIIVELSSVLLKEQIISSVKTFNTLNSASKLNSSHLNTGGPTYQIYVSSYLTPRIKKLHFLAREYCTLNNIKYCWATPTTVYLRKTEGAPSIKLKNEQDLQNLQNHK